MRRTLRRWRALVLLALAALGAGLALIRGEPGQPDLSGPAQVVDGDTLVLRGERVRLHGVDAPESNQPCEREGLRWPCGRDVTVSLRLFLDGRMVRCVSQGRDRFGRVLGRCHAGDQDIGAWLVREGLAVAYTRYSWRYLPQELRARWEGRGLWGGRFEAPEEWRRRNQR
ncbi:thermonuclease family protein [Falsiroseomonas sp.]|uniref:thermonuclease family protein n=1 Tax=Falsiroseomonas sp. TaxID=2870721 RepID=UPI0035690940